MVTTPSGIESPGREELGPAVPPLVLLLQLEKRLLLVPDEDAECRRGEAVVQLSVTQRLQGQL